MYFYLTKFQGTEAGVIIRAYVEGTTTRGKAGKIYRCAGRGKRIVVKKNVVVSAWDGEVEIISNRSGGNVYRRNVFFESRGTLTLRFFKSSRRAA